MPRPKGSQICSSTKEKIGYLVERREYWAGREEHVGVQRVLFYEMQELGMYSKATDWTCAKMGWLLGEARKALEKKA